MAEWPYLPEVGALANRIGAMPDASIPGASGMVWDLRPRKALQGQTDALFVMKDERVSFLAPVGHARADAHT